MAHIYVVRKEGFTATSHLVSAIISYVFWLFKENSFNSEYISEKP